eukprot:NODE_158_length_2618_cov_15.646555_g122_i0.p1 GENE.NODE_158_length_2618_cov_15.646555_g122_i0~~NODE_158_length_2618_cov_15.646555_g122_i0.p1  ORF type:complete len:859 (+),score=228.68 NODE_158_length_2618_cov_15.646555_g122_i0:230-2578(+)
MKDMSTDRHLLVRSLRFAGTFRRPAMFRPQLAWVRPNCLVVAWGNWTTIVNVDLDDRGRHRFVEQQVDLGRSKFVCGVAPFGESSLMFLTLKLKEEDVDPTGQARPWRGPKPQLLSMPLPDPPGSLAFPAVSRGAVEIPGYEDFWAFSYRLDFNEQEFKESSFYMLCPTLLQNVKPIEFQTHIENMLRASRFRDSITCVQAFKQTGDCPHKKLQFCAGARPRLDPEFQMPALGNNIVQRLVEDGNFAAAGDLLPEVCGTDAAAWNTRFKQFESKGKLVYIVDQIPKGERGVFLDPEAYTSALRYYLKKDPRELLEKVNTWPQELVDPETKKKTPVYHVSALIQDVQDERAKTSSVFAPGTFPGDAAEDPNTMLTAALAKLHEYAGQNEDALRLHLQLGRSEVFQFIRKFQLFSVVLEKVEELMSINETQALGLLLERRNADLEPKVIVKAVEKNRPLLLKYLDAVFNKEHALCTPYLSEMVKLYADHQPDKLLAFLEGSHGYNLKEALKIARQHGLVKEEVFVMGRTGATQDALQLIFKGRPHKPGQCDCCEPNRNPQAWAEEKVTWAIRFIVLQDSRDEALLQDLVDACIQDKDGTLISALLEKVTSVEGALVINPIKLLRQIPDGARIQGLKNKLAALIREESYRDDLEKGCLKLLQEDIRKLIGMHDTKRKKGLMIRPTQAVCQVCRGPARDPLHPVEDFVVFACGHTFHARCFKEHRSGCDISIALRNYARYQESRRPTHPDSPKATMKDVPRLPPCLECSKKVPQSRPGRREHGSKR